MLDVQCSMFDVHQFLFQFDWTFSARGWAEHCHLTPQNYHRTREIDNNLSIRCR